jgi:hypothetical protein
VKEKIVLRRIKEISMRLGMNVLVDQEGFAAAKFIRICAKAELNFIRLILTEVDKVPELLLRAVAETNVRVCLLPFVIDPSKHPTLNSDELCKRYRVLSKSFNPAQVFGVTLPEGFHLITKVGAKGKWGMPKDKIRFVASALIDEIRKLKLEPVLPVRPEEIEDGWWGGLNFNTFDIELFFTQNLESRLHHEKISKIMIAEKKKYWYGKAGVVGGYIMPTYQEKFLRKIYSISTDAEYAFLWSEKANPLWEWSRDGSFIVDVMGDSLKRESLVLGGDKNLSNWKAQKRGVV